LFCLLRPPLSADSLLLQGLSQSPGPSDNAHSASDIVVATFTDAVAQVGQLAHPVVLNKEPVEAVQA